MCVQAFHDIPLLPPQIKSSIRLIKEHPQSAESLLNALRYMTTFSTRIHSLSDLASLRFKSLSSHQGFSLKLVGRQLYIT